MVGEDYTGEHSNGHKYQIRKLDHYGNGRQQDVRSKVYGDSLSKIDLTFATEGGHLIAFNNTSNLSSLKPHNSMHIYEPRASNISANSVSNVPIH